METSTTRFWQRGILFLLVWLACGLPNAFAAELGQISGTNKHAWSETSGWLNFKPDNGGGGVTVHAQYLSGYAWAANVGWIKLGADGGGPYDNIPTNTNWGVNRNEAGNLSGYAWGENIGWINFGGVTIDPATGYFSGYAWSANIGYIHLQNAAAPDYKVQTLIATPPGVPAVPGSSATGAFTVSWAASDTVGASYEIQESTNNITFTTITPTISTSVGVVSASITGRATGTKYYYQVRAKKTDYADSAWKKGANACAVSPIAPASITVPTSDADGAYIVKWVVSTTAGVISYEIQESTNNITFTTITPTISTSVGVVSASITGRATGTKYYYQVRAKKTGYADSAWKKGANACAVSPVAPASIKVPASDADGKYTVSWGVSATSGATYVLEEATNKYFSASAGLRTVYTGIGRSFGITGRVSGKTYYYRVKATKTGYTNSTPRAGANGCLVKITAGIPASITVPASDPDGKYQVKWGKSATAGVRYVLQEATNYTFTQGLRTLPSTTGLYVNITRPIGKTYYYRVKAIKAGYTDSAWKNNSSGNAVPGRSVVAAPTALTFTSIILHGYTVNWKASTMAGVTYVLEEAMNSGFTVGLRTFDVKFAKLYKITGRTKGVTYYYRIRAIKSGFRDSVWLKGSRTAT